LSIDQTEIDYLVVGSGSAARMHRIVTSDLGPGGASVEGEGHEFAPWGLAGGKPGEPAELRLIRHNGGIDRLPSKVPHMQIRAGEKFVCVGPAGGGYGDPLLRDPAHVLDDVADGLVSREAARDDYGVIYTVARVLDDSASASLRAEQGAARIAAEG